MGTMGRVLACTLALSLAWLPGCMFVVPKDRKAVVSRTERWRDPVQLGDAMLSVQSGARGTGVAVRVTWQRTCESRGDLIVEHRISKGAGLKVWDGDSAYIALLGLMAAPFTLMISGIATAASIAGSEDRAETTAEPLAPRRNACDAPGAGLDVVVTAPGRGAVTVTTAPDGTAYAELGDVAAALHATVQLARPPPR